MNRLTSLGLARGYLEPGPTDSIADVAGVSVGHVTLADGDVQTGVTAVLPHSGNLFRDKVPAACRVMNGFGKSAGLVQVEELGSIESPILLSNTFSVPACLEGGLDLLLDENPDIATTTGSANVVALECNDGYLSDMRRRAVTRAHVREAIDRARSAARLSGAAGPSGAATGLGGGSALAAGAAAETGKAAHSGAAFERGAVGAGRGMSCYGLKGGIGTSSRLAGEYVVGALLLTNFGRLSELVVGGRGVGREILALGADIPGGVTPAVGTVRAGERDAIEASAARELAADARLAADDPSGVGAPGAGSVIVVLATDAPLDSRQLRRLCIRAASGLARTGAAIGHGSGEIAIAFSTAYTVPHYPLAPVESRPRLHEDYLDPLFRAATEAVEAAVIDSLCSASAVRGRDGHERRSILDFGLL